MPFEGGWLFAPRDPVASSSERVGPVVRYGGIVRPLVLGGGGVWGCALARPGQDPPVASHSFADTGVVPRHMLPGFRGARVT